MNDVKEVYKFVSDFWKFIKGSYIQPELDTEEFDEYWHSLIADGSKLVEAYGKHDLAKRLVLAYLDYQDAVQKGKRDERENYQC